MTVGGIDERFADVNGVRLHYLEAGTADPVMLLHGYAETSHMWRPLIGELRRGARRLGTTQAYDRW